MSISDRMLKLTNYGEERRLLERNNNLSNISAPRNQDIEIELINYIISFLKNKVNSTIQYWLFYFSSNLEYPVVLQVGKALQEHPFARIQILLELAPVI